MIGIKPVPPRQPSILLGMAMVDEHLDADLTRQILALREALEREHAAQRAAVEAATKGLAEENRQLKQTAVALREAMEQAAAQSAERAQQAERSYREERTQLHAIVQNLRLELEKRVGH
ncbi:MAG: hypothetical protein A3H39_14740 [candidate division NC10 bacterium RIFCSPLOWO2_02_FULL_66_22]|nr:MAG: hypothetical protein A3H39_14740 [candidate division NC10 bacterium RIFCSPLOWO2_02_FULL_66_22]